MRLVTLAAPVAAGALLALAGCGSDSSSSSPSATNGAVTSSTATAAYTCVKGTLTASGSTALQPLVQKASTEYQAKCPGATITVAGGGSSTGLSNADTGTSDIGDSDVPSSNAKNLKNALVDHQVAQVIFAVVVNPATGVTALTTPQVQDIFAGKVKSWKEVGGNDVPVSVILRKPGSGTRLSFDKDIMSGVKETDMPSGTQDSTSLVVQGVTMAQGGVSYINVASVGSLTAVSIDGHKPTAAEIASGTYPFFAHEHMYTLASGANSALAQDFINFILSSDFKSTIATLGFIPASSSDKQSAVDAA